MATLAEELVVKVGADVKDLKKGMADAQKATTQATDKMKKSNQGVIDSLDRIKTRWEKIKGVVLLFGAGIIGATAALLKHEHALTKAGGAAMIAGDSVEGLDKKIIGMSRTMRLSVPEAADAAKSAFVDNFTEMGQAIESSGIAKQLEALGFGPASALDKTFRQAAKTFDITTGEAAQLVVQLKQMGATEEDANMLARAAMSMRVPFEQAGVSVYNVGEALGVLTSRGASAQEALGLMRGVFDNVRTGNTEVIDSLNQLGANIDPIDRKIGNFGAVMGLLAQQVDTQRETVLKALGGNQAYLDTLLGIGSNAAPKFIENIGKMKTLVQDLGGVFDASQSSMDRLTEALNELLRKLDELALWVKAKGQAIKDFFGTFAQIKEMQGTPYVNDARLGLATGGQVPGTGRGDTVPAMLEPGEFVIRRKVAEQVGPILQALNVGGITPRALKNTLLATHMVKGIPLLDLLNLNQFPSHSLGSINESSSDRTARLAGAASRILEAVNAIEFHNGGRVRGYAAGGSVTNTTQHVNAPITINTQTVDEAWVRRSLGPMIERMAEQGYSRRKRSGR